MAGIEPLPSMTESQIASLAGGPTLRVEAISSYTRGARLDPADVSMKGPGRLGRYLLEGDIARSLLVQVAQMRQAAVYQAQNTPLKSLSNLFDSVRLLHFYIHCVASSRSTCCPMFLFLFSFLECLRAGIF